MRATTLLGALATGVALLLAPAAQAAGRVEVSFKDPLNFTDIGRGPIDTERHVKLLTEHLQALGRRLPDDQVLKVEVLDVDLAGTVEPMFRHREDVRVLKGSTDWPVITLRYTLTAGGRTLGSGEETLKDMAYLFGLRGLRADEPLAYDRRLLTRWFEERILAP